MNIWLVSIFEQTPVDNVFSTRFLSVADEALSRGHKVTFFGSTFKHNTKNQRFDKTTEINYADNYDLVFIKSMTYSGNVSPKRLWSHYVFSKNARSEFEKRFHSGDKPDVILMAYPPVSLAFETSEWAVKKGIPIVADIIDPWPDLFALAAPDSLKGVANTALKPLQLKFKRTLKNLNKLTSISNQYLAWAKEYHPVDKTECLYPAADFTVINDKVKNAEQVPGFDEKKLKVIYAGSLASSYDIKTILGAADLLRENKEIHFFIAGAGPQESAIKAYMNDHRNVTFLGRLPKEELMRYYAASDLGMTQHIKGATQSVTYKLFDLLSAGLPILNSLESEMKKIIVDNNVGLHNDPGDAKQLATNISYFYDNPEKLKQYKENGLNLAKKEGDVRVIYKRFVDLLEEEAKS